MRMSITIIAAMAVLVHPIQSKAEAVRDPGAGFIGQKHHKAGKNYYVVRSDKGCAIKPGEFGDTPEGAVGDAPYASKSYAKAALKNFRNAKADWWTMRWASRNTRRNEIAPARVGGGLFV